MRVYRQCSNPRGKNAFVIEDAVVEKVADDAQFRQYAGLVSTLPVTGSKLAEMIGLF